MTQSEEKLEPIGAFETGDAKRVIELLEAQGIPFALESDDSALSDPVRPIQLYLGMYPEGPKIVVFVPESKVSTAVEAVEGLFPV